MESVIRNPKSERRFCNHEANFLKFGRESFDDTLRIVDTFSSNARNNVFQSIQKKDVEKIMQHHIEVSIYLEFMISNSDEY